MRRATVSVVWVVTLVVSLFLGMALGIQGLTRAVEQDGAAPDTAATDTRAGEGDDG